MKKTPDFSRRTLLRAGAAFAGSSIMGVLPLRAFAQQMAGLAPADHCFIFAYFSGGWDVLLSLDPRDPAVFTPERVNETRILPDYAATTAITAADRGVIKPAGSNIEFGPAIGNMRNHFDVMALVRGIDMKTVAHEVGRRYFITGKQPAGSAARGSSTATEIVGQMVPMGLTKVPVPSIAYNVESYNDRYGGYANALRVSSQNDLLLTLGQSTTQFDSEIEKELVDMQGRPVSCEADLYNSRGLVSQYREALAQKQTVLTAQVDKYFRFANRSPDDGLNTYRAQIRAAYGLGDGSNTTTSAARAATAATAIKKGISQCVSLTLNTGPLDTHFNRQNDNASSQKTAWDALAALVSDLKNSDFDPNDPSKGKWMDPDPSKGHVTIVCFSEFSRTPLTNAAGGRDHHITNSCMLLGRGIRHNTVFGKSGDVGLSAGIIDFNTGLPKADGLVITPEHVIASILDAANLDYSITREAPLKGLLSKYA